MFAILKKELRGYFINPIGYIYLGVFLVAAALICAFTTIQVGSYNTSSYFQYLIFVFVVLIPLLTMRLFSEERKTRTEQLLLTAPVSITGMVLGKYFAAVILFLIGVVISCLNFFPLVSYAITESAAATSETHIGPVGGQVIGCLVGVVLIGAAFVAIGMFVSALTESQLAAAVVSIAALFGSVLVGIISASISSAPVRVVLNWISLLSRFDAFAMGMFDFSAVLYYVSIAGVFIFLTVRVYDKRRWG